MTCPICGKYHPNSATCSRQESMREFNAHGRQVGKTEASFDTVLKSLEQGITVYVNLDRLLDR